MGKVFQGFECVGANYELGESFGLKPHVGCVCISKHRCRECHLWEYKCEERRFTIKDEQPDTKSSA